MRSQQVRPVPVKSYDARDLESRLESLKDQTRRRAYDLYCSRGERNGNALGDWNIAERECDAVPIVGVAEEERDVRITAFVPNADTSELTVDVLPNEIVVEADCDGKIERFTRLRMPARIDPGRVEARLCGAALEVVAPKAENKHQASSRGRDLECTCPACNIWRRGTTPQIRNAENVDPAACHAERTTAGSLCSPRSIILTY
jgi:HSP20 family molecular chaperone IbpA